MVECLAVEISTAIRPNRSGQMPDVDNKEFRLDVSSACDGKSERVSPGRI
jgi:hypothetical protein